MKKEGLESGMSVELDCGKKGLIVGTRYGLVVQLNEKYLLLSDIKEDLTGLRRGCSSIKKVYDIKEMSEVVRMDICCPNNLIWTRQEETILTIEEIEDRLGITNLKIKK